MKHLSPIEVEILLHYHYSPEQYDKVSPASDNAHKKFVMARILNYDPDKKVYIPNAAALQVYVEAVCSIPLPVIKKQWIIPETNTQ